MNISKESLKDNLQNLGPPFFSDIGEYVLQEEQKKNTKISSAISTPNKSEPNPIIGDSKRVKLIDQAFDILSEDDPNKVMIESKDEPKRKDPNSFQNQIKKNDVKNTIDNEEKKIQFNKEIKEKDKIIKNDQFDLENAQIKGEEMNKEQDLNLLKIKDNVIHYRKEQEKEEFNSEIKSKIQNEKIKNVEQNNINKEHIIQKIQPGSEINVRANLLEEPPHFLSGSTIIKENDLNSKIQFGDFETLEKEKIKKINNSPFDNPDILLSSDLFPKVDPRTSMIPTLIKEEKSAKKNNLNDNEESKFKINSEKGQKENQLSNIRDNNEFNIQKGQNQSDLVQE